MGSSSVHRVARILESTSTVRYQGKVIRVMPTSIEADGPGVPVGSLCAIGDPQAPLLAEVVKVELGRVILAPFGDNSQILIGDRVTAFRVGASVAVGPGLLGRVVDALGQPVDGHGMLRGVDDTWPLAGRITSALDKSVPQTPLETGIRAVDALLTLGVGQRIGIFAGAGVGKTSLLSRMASHIQADALVLCLVGERGREAEEFWHRALDEEARQRATMVVATSDQSAGLRARSVSFAVAIAEYLRAQGKHVLLLVDSMTRYALALRELGLAAGEPPAVRGFTPSVFAALPRIVERCGSLRGSGAITALMTVLTESDDTDDPMAETMRSLLDGHIILSRALAEEGHYPAVEVTRSISRVFDDVVSPPEAALAQQALAQLAIYQRSKLLVDSGLYAAGSNPELDMALQNMPRLTRFLRQDRQACTRADSLKQLAEILEGKTS